MRINTGGLRAHLGERRELARKVHWAGTVDTCEMPLDLPFSASTRVKKTKDSFSVVSCSRQKGGAWRAVR